MNWLFWHFLQLKQKDGKEEEEEKFWPRLPQGALKVGSEGAKIKNEGAATFKGIWAGKVPLGDEKLLLGSLREKENLIPFFEAEAFESYGAAYV